MLARLCVVGLALLGRLTIAQVQLQFVWPTYGSGDVLNSYVSAVGLRNGNIVLVGTNHPGPSGGLLGNPAQRMRIAVGAIGPAPFANDAPTVLPILGGRGNDTAHGAAVDPSGNIWIVGSTDSDDFNLVNPVVSQKYPYRTAGFVLELDPTGTKLLFSTYFAGQLPPMGGCFSCRYATYATAIAIDASGNVYVGGTTNERDFPTTPGAFLTSSIGGADTFGNTFFYSWVAKISASGKMVYSTFIDSGESLCSCCSACIGYRSRSAGVNSLAVDGSGTVTLAGTKSGSYNPGSGYVARLAADGSRLLWSARVGANYGWVTSLRMAQDSSGTLHLFGTYANVVFNPVAPAGAGTPGLFAEKLSADGSTVISSIDLGQSPDARLAGIVLDNSSNVYLAGTSSSSQFPSLPGVPNLGADFILGLDTSGSKANMLLRFPRGTVSAQPSIDPARRILVPGETGTLLTISRDKVFESPGIVAIADSASFALNRGVSRGELISLLGFGFSRNSQVFIDDAPATVLYADANQINLQVPFGQPFGSLPRVRVVSQAGTVEVNNVPRPGALGMFTSDGTHAAALNQDGTVNSVANPAARGSIVTLFGTGAIWPSGTPSGVAASSAVSIRSENRFLVVDDTGSPANIFYAGTAPGLLYGVFQLNVQLPPEAVGRMTLLQLSSPIWTSPASNTVQVYLK